MFAFVMKGVAHQIFQALYFMGIALYHRDELQAAEEILASVINEPYFQYAWNFIHSAFAFALVHQARGRTDAANQAAESVISYGLDTNHPVVLELARVFQAELAIRQGRTAEASQPLVEPLTNRELEILNLLVQRLSNKEIADKLFISPETVKKHLNKIYGKLNVANRREAVDKAKKIGIL
jgi:LuxR family maltose regulon positive regulatory protein